MKHILFGFVALACLACQGSTGVGLARLHVEATNSDGTSVAGFEGDDCTTLPILPGSRIEDKIPIALRLEVVVDATRDQAEVSFRGAKSSPPARVIGEATLRSGYSEELSVDALSGSTFNVILTSGCPVTTGKP